MLSNLKEKSSSSNIIYFDGLCGICNKFVDFILRKDSDDKFVFAPLQGKTAEQNLSPTLLKNLNTLVYQTPQKTYIKSDASLMILFHLGRIYKVAIILRLVPKFIRDGIYSYIAKNRYEWFGKRKECRLPTEYEKDKILL